MTFNIRNIALGIGFEIYTPENKKQKIMYHLKYGGLNYVTSI
jgi:hypothetical protein